MEKQTVIVSDAATIALENGDIQLAKKICNDELKKSDNADAVHFLGVIAFFEQKLEEAEKFIKKSIQLEPENYDFHFNLAKIYQNQGKFDEAIHSYQYILNFTKKIREVFIELSALNWQIGKEDLAIEHALDGVIHSDYDREHVIYLIDVLGNANHLKWNSKIERVLDKILDLDFDCQKLSRILCVGIKNKVDVPKKEILYKTHLEQFNQPFFLKVLQKVVLCDLEVEEMLTLLRKTLLINFSIKFNLEKKWFELLYSIAVNNYLNEYVHTTTDLENKILPIIEDSEESEAKLLVYACYGPIVKKINTKNEFVIELLNKLSELEEIVKYKKNIKQLTPIDEESFSISKQYEQFPYPRWNKVEKPLLNFHQEWNELFPHEQASVSVKKVLIAGCGTGNQAVYASHYYPGAKVEAVDLSALSLSYAALKTKESKCSNLQYYQADILNLEKIEEYKEKFDVIECVGVLHHIKDFEKALKNILYCLKSDGLLKLGLYSQFARKNIIEIRKNLILPFDLDVASIKKLRRDLLYQYKSELGESSDFYTLSNFKDLILNNYERQFTLLEIKEILQKNKLNFVGFVNLTTQIKVAYSQYNPGDENLTSLDAWHEFERFNPYIFCGMYQFWLKK